MKIQNSGIEDTEKRDIESWKEDLKHLRSGISSPKTGETERIILMRDLNRGLDALQDRLLRSRHLIEGDRDLQIIKDALEVLARGTRY